MTSCIKMPKDESDVKPQKQQRKKKRSAFGSVGWSMHVKGAGIAQSVEHQTCNRKVTGSSPGIGSVCHINFPILKLKLVCWCQDNGTSCHEMTNGESYITPKKHTICKTGDPGSLPVSTGKIKMAFPLSILTCTCSSGGLVSTRNTLLQNCH